MNDVKGSDVKPDPMEWISKKELQDAIGIPTQVRPMGRFNSPTALLEIVRDLAATAQGQTKYLEAVKRFDAAVASTEDSRKLADMLEAKIRDLAGARPEESLSSVFGGLRGLVANAQVAIKNPGIQVYSGIEGEILPGHLVQAVADVVRERNNLRLRTAKLCNCVLERRDDPGVDLHCKVCGGSGAVSTTPSLPLHHAETVHVLIKFVENANEALFPQDGGEPQALNLVTGILYRGEHKMEITVRREGGKTAAEILKERDARILDLEREISDLRAEVDRRDGSSEEDLHPDHFET